MLTLLAWVCFSLLGATDEASVQGASLSAEDPYVVVVTGQGSVDRVVAGSLGDAVLSLSPAESIASMAAHVRVLNPSRVVVLGGQDVVSADAFTALRTATTAPVSRLAGQDRYETAARAALATFTRPVPQVLIATSDVSLDAARRRGLRTTGSPVLLVTRDGVPTSTVRALQQLQPATVTVVGGAGVVSTEVMRQLQQYAAGRVERARFG